MAEEKIEALSGWDSSRPRRNIAMKVSYVGAKYGGFSLQPHDDNTVEYHLFKALRRTRLMNMVELSGYCRAGRTDRGVSAVGNVISLFLRTNQDPAREFGGKAPSEDDMPSVSPNAVLDQEEARAADHTVDETEDVKELDNANMLNNVLPADIRVKQWAPVPVTFNARFCATWREYRYYFLPGNLDHGEMAQAAKYFEGYHDFTAFCKMDVTHPKDGAGLTPQSSQSYFRVRGHAFLWHQVRAMAAVLFTVGQGLEEPEVVQRMLARDPGFDRKPNYALADDLPLCLMDVGFDSPVMWRASPECQSKLRAQVLKLHSDFATQASVTAAIVEDVTGEPVQTKPWFHPALFPMKNGKLVYVSDGDKKYVPLSKRKGEPTYGERIKALEARKRKAGEMEQAED
ncbi:tRNA pseudouridine synthase [Carpediemonas membranifera]|uniref:tRNA pseudouridine synthase n=1 Tax=Carpediemonas membranifera TaxID=201153 RepID=A0A8J6EAT9_9EUKA|nr:tRNA pseudouridine synthase [Carpediemonas membranifera]|eukprot:KAG9395350.1 tRNA pseudouridine synthase [Carpediemonas membranifera]